MHYFLNFLVSLSLMGSVYSSTNKEQDTEKRAFPRVLIVGGGIAGLATAVSLENSGCQDIDLIEKKQKFDVEGAGIALPANAVWVLKKLGIPFEEQAYPINRMQFSDEKGEILWDEEITNIHPEGTGFYSIDRPSLHTVLKNSLKITRLRMNLTVMDFQEKAQGTSVTFSDNSTAWYDLIIAADGANSGMRQLCDSTYNLTPLGIHAWRTIINSPENLHYPIYMLGWESIFLLYPLKDQKTYIYAHKVESTLKPDHHTTALDDILETFKDFKGNVPFALKELQKTSKILSHTMYTSSIKWRHGKSILFLGDAAHTFSPMLQNGGAQALEDAYVLGDILNQMTDKKDIDHWLKEFVLRRHERVQWVQTTSDQKILALTHDQAMARNERIRIEGAPNIKGFKILMQKNP